MVICDWTLFNKELIKVKKIIEVDDIVIDPFLIINLIEKKDLLLKVANQYSTSKFPINDSLGPLSHKKLEGRIKVAFLSADFREHPMGYNFVGFFENLDRSKFEVIAVSFIEVSDSPLSQRLVAAFDEFKIVNKMTDTEVCQWMREKHIDIAVDMMGPTLNNRQDRKSTRLNSKSH